MEYLSRKIKIRKKEKSFNEIRVDWIDGMRLSLRFFNKEEPDEDIVINFTKEESEKIQRVVRKKSSILNEESQEPSDGAINRSSVEQRRTK
jgi:uncharacterized protein YpiB (UPF0302 family)